MRHFIIFKACTKPNITLCYRNFITHCSCWKN